MGTQRPPSRSDRGPGAGSNGVSPVVQRLLDANEQFSRSWAHGDLAPEPQLAVVVVTCMDARVQPSDFLDIRPGDAHILRTAGGRVTDDVIRSLIVSTTLLGTRTVMLVHHTDCGLASHDQDGLVAAVGSSVGATPAEVDFCVIGDPHEALREDVERIVRCPYLPDGLEVVAGTYDVQTGRMGVEIVSRHGALTPT